MNKLFKKNLDYMVTTPSMNNAVLSKVINENNAKRFGSVRGYDGGFGLPYQDASAKELLTSLSYMINVDFNPELREERVQHSYKKAVNDTYFLKMAAHRELLLLSGIVNATINNEDFDLDNVLVVRMTDDLHAYALKLSLFDFMDKRTLHPYNKHSEQLFISASSKPYKEIISDNSHLHICDGVHDFDTNLEYISDIIKKVR